MPCRYGCQAASFGQSEVELFLLQIGRSHFYADRVAQLILVMAVASDETIVAFVKVVLVNGEVAHGHQSLAMVLVDLAVYAV